MKAFNKNILNRLWERNIVDIYFNGNKNLNNETRELDRDF